MMVHVGVSLVVCSPRSSAELKPPKELNWWFLFGAAFILGSRGVAAHLYAVERRPCYSWTAYGASSVPGEMDAPLLMRLQSRLSVQSRRHCLRSWFKMVSRVDKTH